MNFTVCRVFIGIGHAPDPHGTRLLVDRSQFDRDARGTGAHGRFGVAAESLQPRLRVGHVIVVPQVEEQAQALVRVGVCEAPAQRDLGVRAIPADESVAAHRAARRRPASCK